MRHLGGLDRSDAGFTLMELLVVIAILGVLSVVAVLSLAVLRNSSDEATCSADKASIVSAEDTAKATINRYLDEADLISQKYLKGQVTGYNAAATGGGSGYSLSAVSPCS